MLATGAETPFTLHLHLHLERATLRISIWAMAHIETAGPNTKSYIFGKLAHEPLILKDCLLAWLQINAQGLTKINFCLHRLEGTVASDFVREIRKFQQKLLFDEGLLTNIIIRQFISNGRKQTGKLALKFQMWSKEARCVQQRDSQTIPWF